MICRLQFSNVKTTRSAHIGTSISLTFAYKIGEAGLFSQRSLSKRWKIDNIMVILRYFGKTKFPTTIWDVLLQVLSRVAKTYFSKDLEADKQEEHIENS